jgi:hypothetical protein
LEGFEAIKELHVVIEPVSPGENTQPEDGVLIITDANGAMFRVKVLAAADGAEQETLLLLTGLAEVTQP